jgi:hypothetical protein
MPDNPWVAIDAVTPPAERASHLRSAWERFQGDGRAEAVRLPIAQSWRRSHAAGVDPSVDHVAPILSDSGEAAARWDAHPLAAAAPLIRACLGPVAAEAQHLIVVSDAHGLLLWIEGDVSVRVRAADRMNFTAGAMWSENGAGTNAVGTALAVDHAVQVFAAEHFNEVVQEWTCSAAPVHDPDSGELLGVIDLTGAMSTVHPHSFGLAVATAQAVEAHLRCVMQDNDQRLRSKYDQRITAGGARRALVVPSGRVIHGDTDGWTGGERLALPAGGGELVLPSGVPAFAEPVGHEEAFVLSALDRAAKPGPTLRLTLLGHDQAIVEVAGRPTQISRRHSEIVALLAARPPGMTTEELAADLYGDAGQPGTVRVQVFRLRKLLGPWIETEPYRLTVDVESDVARVRGLLARGLVREAAECYPGALLPHSEAPGIARERDALEAWLRQAVLTADDPEALWAWLQCPSGGEDLPAWRRLLANIDYSDPRRSLAAAHVGTLRAAYELTASS